MKISVEDTTQSWDFALSRDDSIILITKVIGHDTTIIDEGLIPETDYYYTVYFGEQSEYQDSSLVIDLTTMDTTTHHFTWNFDTLGMWGSVLFDVAVIDDDNIWVVGEIKMLDPDSSFDGTGIEKFNAAHWNGSEWEVMAFNSGAVTLYNIKYFSSDDIWVCSGIPMHWDGTEWSIYHLWQMGILGIEEGGVYRSWGVNSGNIYFAGNEGSIVHYDGTNFSKLNNSANFRLNDISGYESHIWITGYEDFKGTGLLYSNNTNFSYYHHENDPVYDIYLQNSISGRVASVWTDEGNYSYVLTQTAIFKVPTDTEKNVKTLIKPQDGWNCQIQKLRGNNNRDLFSIGNFGYIWHFNGETLQTYPEIVNNENLLYYSIDVKDDMVVAVGYSLDGYGAPVTIDFRD